MASASLVLGAVLTFATTDGAQLNLTVSLSETATAALEWGPVVHTSSTAGRRHRFGPLPMPTREDLRYRLRPASGPAFEATVKPIPKDGLRIALYGDSRDGHGPHRTLMAAIAEADPHILVHTGDVVHRAGRPGQWAEYLAASLPVSAGVPVVLALGNHELWQPWDSPAAERVDALAEAMAEIPPPDDPTSRGYGAGPATFHVRLKGMVLVTVNSNVSMAADSQQLRYLDAVLSQHQDATFKLVTLHHGPMSSGKHGPHPDAEAVIAAFERLAVTASLAGHDHTYERIERGPVTYLVSGGGGAPLYERGHWATGSKAFASTYNWSMLTLEGDRLAVQSYSLEGALLDRVERPATRAAKSQGSPWAALGLAIVVFGLALLGVLARLVFGTRVARSRRYG